MLCEEAHEAVQSERDRRAREGILSSRLRLALLARLVGRDDLRDLDPLLEARLADRARQPDEVRQAGTKDGRSPRARGEREEEVFAPDAEDEQVGDLSSRGLDREGECVRAGGRGDADGERDGLSAGWQDEARGGRDGEPGWRQGRRARLDNERPRGDSLSEWDTVGITGVKRGSK